jgi:hypothetical protein
MATKGKKQISLFPPDQQIAAIREKLPIFKAHDLRSLLAEANPKQNADEDDIGLVAAALRHRTADQMQDLLRRLGVDPSQPDAWRRGFWLLAVCHHGVGHIAWYPRRTSRNAARWTPEHDYDLLCQVTRLKAEGLSERGAIAKIATDPRRRKSFPIANKKEDISPKVHNKKGARLPYGHIIRS